MAPFPASRGELTLALRIAHELYAQGDRALFLACKPDAGIFRNTPFEFIPIDDELHNLNAYMKRLIDEYHPDSFILADLITNSAYLGWQKIDPSFLIHPDIPVIAMDVYDLKPGHYTADLFLTESVDLSNLKEIPVARILPVPFLSTTASPLAYNALPEVPPPEPGAREWIREEFGITQQERLIFMVGAVWQTPAFHFDPHCKRMAEFVPRLLSYYANKIGDDIRVIHVGPEAYRAVDILKDKYLWLPQVDPRRFRALLSGADLFVTPNIAGTTLATVMILGLPMVVVKNSVRALTLEEALSQIPETPSDGLRDWLRDAVPVYPFHVWPIGYYDFVSPLMSDNPFCNTFQSADLLFEDAVLSKCRTLLYDDVARSQIKKAQSEYVDKVRSLPRAVDLLNRYL